MSHSVGSKWTSQLIIEDHNLATQIFKDTLWNLLKNVYLEIEISNCTSELDHFSGRMSSKCNSCQICLFFILTTLLFIDFPP